jgi:hypothetical protein
LLMQPERKMQLVQQSISPLYLTIIPNFSEVFPVAWEWRIQHRTQLVWTDYQVVFCQSSYRIIENLQLTDEECRQVHDHITSGLLQFLHRSSCPTGVARFHRTQIPENITGI